VRPLPTIGPAGEEERDPRDLLERIRVDEEHHVDWIEAQEHKIAEVGYQQYLARQIYA
jgi:bacterioferritin (cytochrome b1)